MELPTQQPRLVLSEEEYTDTLTNIIQRDFFPQVPDLERQAAILERRAAKDFVGAVVIRRAARRLQEHEQALADQEAFEELDLGEGGDHNNHNGAGACHRRQTARPLHRESVSGFHARVTTVDNADFDQQQREQLQAARDHLEIVFRNRNKEYLKITNGSHQSMLLCNTNELNNNSNGELVGATPLLASDKFMASPHRITAAEWQPAEVQNGFFFTPSISNATSTNETKQELRLLTNSSNSSMPPPPTRRKSLDQAITHSSQKDPRQQSQIQLQETNNLVEYIPKRVLEKKIEPSQTRFPSVMTHVSQQQLQQATSTSRSSTEDYSTDASNTTDLDAPPRPLEQERQSRTKRQRIEQDRLVVMTPLLVPGRDGVDASPIMTWGTVSSTPLVLGGAGNVASATASLLHKPTRAILPDQLTDTTLTSVTEQQCFRLPAPSERDQRAAKAQVMLIEQAARRRSASSSLLRRSTTSPVTSQDRSTNRLVDSLTPAARSLLEKLDNGSQSRSSLQSSQSCTPRSRDAFGSALRASYNNNQTPKRSRHDSSNNSSTSSTRMPNIYSSLSRHPMLGRSYSSTPQNGMVSSSTKLSSSLIVSSEEEMIQNTNTSKNPTDGLLNLTKR